MEHLPLPHKAGPHVRVPYIGKQYDGGPFESYPQRHGWKITFLGNPQRMEVFNRQTIPSDHELASFLQTWFYFGLIKDLFKELCDQSEFLEIGLDGQTYLTTEKLEPIFARCSSCILGIIPEVGAQPIMNYIVEKSKTLNQLQQITYDVLSRRTDLLDGWFVVALAALHEALHQFLVDLSKHEEIRSVFDDNKLNQYPWRIHLGHPSVEPANPIFQAMLSREWCPNDIEILRNEAHSMSHIYYRSHMTPRMAHRSHQQCKERHCLATTIVPSTFQLQHVRPSCGCKPVTIDNAALCALIDENRLPVIEIIQASDASEIQLKLRARVPGEDFAAISHVWAEGLGNPFDNALPACQMAKLKDWVKESSPKEFILPIWIDTLLVPVRPQEMQRKALGQMRVPYEQSKFVLVLDSYLWKVEESTLDVLELFAALQCCTWSQRVWTLQEARLGPKILFQFADRAIELWTAFVEKVKYHHSPSNRSPRFNPGRGLRSELITDYGGHAWSNELQGVMVPGSITSTRYFIKRRSVTVAADEPLCLACLMNKNIELVASTHPGDRMAVLWSQFDKVSTGLLFSHAPKLSVPGLRWAPESFLGWNKTSYQGGDPWLGANRFEGDESATPTRLGLRFRLSEIRFRPGADAMERRFDPAMQGSGMYSRFEENNFYRDSRNGMLYIICWEDGKPWSDKVPKSPPSSDSAVILDRTLPVEVPQNSALNDDIEIERCGILINECHIPQTDSNDVIFGRGDRHVHIGSLTGLGRVIYDAAWRGAEQMLTAKGLKYWILTPVIAQECELKAQEILKDSELDDALKLWKSDKSLTRRLSNVDFTAQNIAVFGATLDQLWFDVTEEMQEWCVD